MKILSLLKKNSTSGSYSGYDNAKSGLFNSCKITNDVLNTYGVETHIEICVDGNEIDKFVSLHKPTICVLEAIWVTPDKILELSKLHKNVKFIIRVHSKLPFLAMEGVAIGWLKEYIKISNVFIGFNNEETSKELNAIGIYNFYMPNLYPVEYVWNNSYLSQTVDVGCFGAVRPMKNHLLQAVAAITWGNKKGKIINFHINASRLEQRGENVLKNLRALFKDTEHTLIEHEWMERKDFLQLISEMDFGLQVSMSESFNIVSADFVKMGVPIIVGEDIDWMPSMLISQNNINDIVYKIDTMLFYKPLLVLYSTYSLKQYNNKSIKTWIKLLIQAT